jgi:hypothetical protein
VILVAVSTLIGIAWQQNAYAAQTSTVGGDALKISPVRWDLTVDPGTTKVIEVFIQNLTDVPTTLHPAINDFMASSDESGAPRVILDEDKYAPSHSFKRFVQPLSNIVVGPHEMKIVKVSVVIPKDSAGGGYYGAVRFSPTSEVGGKNVNLSASVGSLILLRVNGAVKEQLSIASFDVRQQPNDDKQQPKVGSFFTSNKKISSIVRFTNGGNVQVAPFGTITLRKSGKTLSTARINEVDPRGLVLPDSIRRFEVNLNKVGSFGKYTVEGSFGYGSSGQLLTSKKTFYVVPVMVFVLIGLGIAVLLFLIFGLPRIIRNYNKRVIRRASRRR